MVYSNSVKAHIGLKSEFLVPQENNKFEQQIKELMDRVRRLEEENKSLRQENKHIKQLYDGIYKDFHREKQRIIDSMTRNSTYQVPAQMTEEFVSDMTSGINRQENSINRVGRESNHSRASSSYKITNFYPNEEANKIGILQTSTDMSRSYSFENCDYRSVHHKQMLNPNILMSYDGTINKNSHLLDKENMINNLAVKCGKQRSREKESALVQKVSKILEKRDLNNKNTIYTPRLDDGSKKGVICDTLKHSKKEIISRINTKYGNK